MLLAKDPQLRFRLKHRRKPQKGDSKDDALFTGQSGNHRPSQFQLISPSFHHTGPLRSLLSAYTKHRAELLTGGGKAVLARLLVCRGWQLTGRIRRLIFSSVSRFTSSLLRWCSTITFFLCGGTIVRLIHQLAFFLTGST